MTDTLDLPASIGRTARAAAEAALGAVPSASPLTAGDPTRQPITLEGLAVSAHFTGSVSGDLVVVVDRTVAEALKNSPLGALDPAQALRPALEAAAAAVGPVVVGAAEVLEPGVAMQAVLAKPGGVLVPLLADGAPHAALALSLPLPEAATGKASTPGFDLLRGVEMEVTAELGRARMTLNELLMLRDGAVIELDRAAGAPADLLVNGRLIARGEVVVIDENFGLRITEIVSDATAR